MTYLEILRVAFSAIRASKLRSVLTTLGIVIGVGAVITMIALGSGAQAAVEAQLNALGTDLLSVSAGQSYWHGVASTSRVSVTSDDALALMREGRTLKAVVPSINRRQQVVFDDQNVYIDVIATTAVFAEARRLALAQGRTFTEGDDHARRRMAVIGADVPDELKTTAEALLGSEISIRGIAFEVVGILARKGTGGRDDPDESIFIPFRTGQYRIFGTDRLSDITVQVRDAKKMNASILEIETIMRSEHRLRPEQADDFRLRPKRARRSPICSPASRR
jgi:putative ABC transport system permease protein